MAIERYLAMTAPEIASCEHLTVHTGYMACHFSPYGTGLTDFPGRLPPGDMLILNDRIPLRGHEPGRILAGLRNMTEQFSCGSILLDFERSDIREAGELAAMLAQKLPCPVGVSANYAAGLSCPVFLPPPPHDVPLSRYLAPWSGREIWLEAALDGTTITLTAAGAQVSPPVPFDDRLPLHRDPCLHCSYQVRTGSAVRFALCRLPEDLSSLLDEAEALGVARAVGLYQELGGIWT